MSDSELITIKTNPIPAFLDGLGWRFSRGHNRNLKYRFCQTIRAQSHFTNGRFQLSQPMACCYCIDSRAMAADI